MLLFREILNKLDSCVGISAPPKLKRAGGMLSGPMWKDVGLVSVGWNENREGMQGRLRECLM